MCSRKDKIRQQIQKYRTLVGSISDKGGREKPSQTDGLMGNSQLLSEDFGGLWWS